MAKCIFQALLVGAILCLSNIRMLQVVSHLKVQMRQERKIELQICKYNVLRADSCFLYSFKLSLWLSQSIQRFSFLSLSSFKSFVFQLLISLNITQINSLSFSNLSTAVKGSIYFQIWLALALRLISLIYLFQSFRLTRTTVQVVISVFC